MLFVSIDHPAISCRDVNRQADWYCRNLGMKSSPRTAKRPQACCWDTTPGQSPAP